MLYPKITKSNRGRWIFGWRSTRTGFRYGGDSFWRWLRYPFTKPAWARRGKGETCPCHGLCRKDTLPDDIYCKLSEQIDRYRL